MAEASEREERQAELLDAYCAALAAGCDARPPADLDVGLAAVVRELYLSHGVADPEPAFAARLRRRLVLRAAGAVEAGESARVHWLPWLGAAAVLAVGLGWLLWTLVVAGRSVQPSPIVAVPVADSATFAVPAQAPVAIPAPMPPQAPPAAAPAPMPAAAGAAPAARSGAPQAAQGAAAPPASPESAPPLTRTTLQGMTLEAVPDSGVLVSAVQVGSPAAQAGVAPLDYLIGVDGGEVRSLQEALARLRGLQAGQTARLDVLRNGQRQTLPFVPSAAADPGGRSR